MGREKRRKRKANQSHTTGENTSAGQVPHQVALWKKFVFSGVLVISLILIVELVLTFAGVKPIVHQHDPYVGFSSRTPVYVEDQGDDGEPIMVTAQNKLLWFNRQEFSRAKPSNTYRIFCLGGSTTFGRPYDYVTSFGGWLESFLQAADDSRNWGVINAGAISYASYRVAVVMEEMIRYEPDLLIIYTGHNEFLERRTYGETPQSPSAVRRVDAALSNLRSYTLVKSIASPSAAPTGGDGPQRDQLPGEVETMLEKTVGLDAYQRDISLQHQVLEHYRFNLARMIRMARDAGADVILVSPASNLRSCSPFKNQHRDGLTDKQLTAWQEMFDMARLAAEQEQWSEALAALDEAAGIDDQYAELHYVRGRALYELGRYEESYAALVRARDEDVCPLRAITPVIDAAAEVAREQNVPWIDFVALLDEQSERGVPGEDLFLDHAHPTIAGNRMLALSLLEKMTAQGLVTPSPDWGDKVIEQVTQQVESSLDREAHALALRNLATLLRWAGKIEEADKLALRAIQMLPQDAVANHAAGKALAGEQRFDEAARHFRQAIELEPDWVDARLSLAELLSRQGDLDGALHQYEQLLEINPESIAAHCSLGAVLVQQGHIGQAEEHILRALENDPDHADSLANMGALRYRQDRLDEAVEFFQRSLELTPDNADTHQNLGRAFFRLNKFDQAMAQYRITVRLAPDDADAHYNLASALVNLQQPEQAEKHYQLAIRHRPDFADAEYAWGVLLAGQGELQQAAEHLQRTIEIRPEYAEAHNNLGVLLAQSRDYQRAAEHFEKALQIRHDFQDARNNLERVKAVLKPNSDE